MVWPCFQVSGTCDRVMMVLVKSLRDFAIDLDDAFTARGGMKSCPVLYLVLCYQVHPSQCAGLSGRS